MAHSNITHTNPNHKQKSSQSFLTKLTHEIYKENVAQPTHILQGMCVVNREIFNMQMRQFQKVFLHYFTINKPK